MTDSEAQRLELLAGEALARLKRYADFPEVHLSVIENSENLANAFAPTLLPIGLPCPERLDFTIKLMDVWAGGYVRLVRTMADHDDFHTLLNSYEWKAWEVYRGIAEIEPFGHNRELAAIKARSHYWYKESLRRLIPASRAVIRLPRRGYREEVQEWMKRKQIESIPQAARRLGLSESALKSIMSDKGNARYGEDTLKRVLEEIKKR